ncbi:MAG: lipoyl(octanoyl) transferase [Deltaproteobacteria bacterium]|nr:MAG: lipoyl(octanoyl) transferase [Deltaproteobacteria bacterium]
MHWVRLYEYDTLPYEQAHRLQLRLVNERVADPKLPPALILLEHPPVFTLGRRGDRSHLHVTPSFLSSRNIPLLPAERGGNITYHGPGQLVVYPIVYLRQAGMGIPGFVSLLETLMIETASGFGVSGTRIPNRPGVWVGEKKLGSVGLALRKGVTFHGLALNVTTDLTPFTWITPCGLSAVQMTSLARETAGKADMAAVRCLFKALIEKHGHCQLREMAS